MDELVVKWPARTFAFYAQVRAASDAILNKTILAIDPSSGGSSQPGYAIFKAGKLVDSGELKLPGNRHIQVRLAVMHDLLRGLLPNPPDILVLEDVSLGKMSHVYLKWAVGATIAAVASPEMIITPINVWKALAKVMPAYTKTNATDAVLIGQSVILLAQEWQAQQKKIKLRRKRRR